MNADDLCICTHTHEVHFDGNCSAPNCPCKEFALIDAGLDIYEALKAMRDMTQSGWITPEDKPTDWQLGWEAACEQFKIARTNELAEAAIRKAKGE